MDGAGDSRIACRLTRCSFLTTSLDQRSLPRDGLLIEMWDQLKTQKGAWTPETVRNVKKKVINGIRSVAGPQRSPAPVCSGSAESTHSTHPVQPPVPHLCRLFGAVPGLGRRWLWRRGWPVAEYYSEGLHASAELTRWLSCGGGAPSFTQSPHALACSRLR